MAKVSNFIYCISAERTFSPDGKGENINAIGVLSALTPEFIPGTFSFSIIFSIVNVNLKDANKIQILFKDVNERILVDSNEILIPAANVEDPISIPDEYKGINMSMDMRNIVFEKEGVYSTCILFNGECVGKFDIYAKGRR